MADLDAWLFLPQYALSRHTQWLEATGCIRRSRRPVRGGAGGHARIWEVYERVIRAGLGHRMSTDEAYELSWMLICLYPAEPRPSRDAVQGHGACGQNRKIAMREMVRPGLSSGMNPSYSLP